MFFLIICQCNNYFFLLFESSDILKAPRKLKETLWKDNIQFILWIVVVDIFLLHSLYALQESTYSFCFVCLRVWVGVFLCVRVSVCAFVLCYDLCQAITLHFLEEPAKTIIIVLIIATAIIHNYCYHSTYYIFKFEYF